MLDVEKPSGLSSREGANGRNPKRGETKKDPQVPWLVLKVALLFPKFDVKFYTPTKKRRRSYMNVEFIGKAVEWTDAMKSFVEGKLERFSRLLKEAEEDQVEVVITLSTSRAKHKDYAGESRPTVFRVDLDLYLKTWGGGVIHAWEEDVDVFSALDKVLDEAERQIIKLKQRRLEQRRKGHKIKEELLGSITAPSREVERPTIIEEELVIEKPMSEEDAIFELQESGVFFLPFVDAKTGELKIAYRKRSGSFGIINTRCRGA